MADLLLAIDVGTTGTKASLITPDGLVAGSAYQEYGCYYPKPGWVEQDLDVLLRAVCATSAEAIAKSASPAADIKGVSFSTQRTCTIFLDRDGKLVRPMISWQDNRPVDEVNEIAGKLGSEKFHGITGLPLNTTWNIGKILWLRANEPASWSRVARVCQLQDYMLLAFGSDGHFTDSAAVSLFGLWDIKAFAWSEEILKTFDIDRRMLPEAVVPGTVVGKVSQDISARTGIPAGIPLVVGAGDQNSAVVGAGVVEKGTMSVSLGTGGLVGAYLGVFPEGLDTSSNILNHAIKGKYQLEGYQAGAAGVFKWFSDQITTLEGAYAASTGGSLYRILDDVAGRVPAGSKGLLFMPYLASACAPRWNPDARGAFLGLAFAHDRACMIRAVLEGITLEVRDILEAMYRAGATPDMIRILGGPTKSNFWNQLQADVYNRPVETLRVTDAALLGAAIFAGVGAGIYSDIREGVGKLVKADKIYQPDPRRSMVYWDMYEIYKKAYDALAGGVFTSLAEFQRKNGE